MFDIVTIGGASRDVFFMTDKGRVINDLVHHQKILGFEHGSKVIPNDSKFTYGGGGLNAAVSFVKLGLSVSTLLNIGSEGSGSLIINSLHSYGVDIEHVNRDYVNHTAMSIIISIPGEDHIMFLYRGANDFLKVHDWRPLRAKWFYVASLTGDSADLLPEIFTFARSQGIKVAWNPGSEQLAGGYSDLSSFLEETAILSLNRSEAEELVRSRKRIKLGDEKLLLRELYNMTKGLVVITDGKNGSYATDGEKEYYMPASTYHKVLETTGAGDAFGSTFVAMKLLGYGTKHSMKAAAFNAGSVIEHIGAQDGLMTFNELSAKIESKNNG
ncbi:MAG: carbohydrate kinase family protein [bacterium]